jgi:hypothetical protein
MHHHHHHQARWWRESQQRSLKQFFSFPPLINEGESRLHNAVVLVHILLFNLLGLLALLAPPAPATAITIANLTTAQFVLGTLLVYGFSARLLFGPRLDPHAFFVLFVLSPLLLGTRPFPSLYKDLRHHRFSLFLSLSLTIFPSLLLLSSLVRTHVHA